MSDVGVVARGDGAIIRPVPSDEEAAAIMAAVEALWPRPGGQAATATPTPAWRFSGRWWVKPVAARRRRPW